METVCITIKEGNDEKVINGVSDVQTICNVLAYWYEYHKTLTIDNFISSLERVLGRYHGGFIYLNNNPNLSTNYKFKINIGEQETIQLIEKLSGSGHCEWVTKEYKKMSYWKFQDKFRKR